MNTRNVTNLYNAVAGGYECDPDTGLIPHPFELRNTDGDLLLPAVPGFWFQNIDAGNEGWTLVKASMIDYLSRLAGEPSNPAWILPPELETVPPITQMGQVIGGGVIVGPFDIAYVDLGDGEVPCAYDEGASNTVIPLDKLWLLNTRNTNRG